MWGYQGQGNSIGNNYSNHTSLLGNKNPGNMQQLNMPTGSGNKLDYRPQLGDVRQLNYMENQDFNPMRQRAMSDVEGSASSNYAGLVSNLARSGGVTQADRMNAMRERGKQAGIGNVQVGSRLAEIESGSRADVERHNKGLQNEMYRTNLDMQNRATEFNINNKFALEDRNYRNEWEREKHRDAMVAAGKVGDAMDKNANKKHWVDNAINNPYVQTAAATAINPLAGLAVGGYHVGKANKWW